MSVRGDMLFCTDAVAIKLSAQQAEESSDGYQELRTCSATHTTFSTLKRRINELPIMFTLWKCPFPVPVKKGEG